jgi:hypothetical protein
MKLERLLYNAKQCRSLADSALTPEAREVLLGMALDYEERAERLRTNGTTSFPSFSMAS